MTLENYATRPGPVVEIILRLQLLPYHNKLVVDTSIHFHPSLIFVGKARSIPLQSHKGLHSGRLQHCSQIID